MLGKTLRVLNKVLENLKEWAQQIIERRVIYLEHEAEAGLTCPGRAENECAGERG